MIKIGLDFDNTVINYNKIYIFFNKRLNLKIAKNKINKNTVKRKIIENYSEHYWTFVQEEIYGKFLHMIHPDVNFKDFILKLKKKKVKFYIISHKTKYSEFSKKYKLRNEALHWINKNISYYKFNVNFFDTAQEKINFIKKENIHYHIDDLYDIFENKNFNKNCKKIFFNIKKNFDFNSTSWSKIRDFIFNEIN